MSHQVLTSEDMLENTADAKQTDVSSDRVPLSTQVCRRKRGPRSSPAKIKRDAARVDAHHAQTVSQEHSEYLICAASDPEEAPIQAPSTYLEPIAESRARVVPTMDARKTAEKERLRKQLAAEQVASSVTMSTT